MAQTIDNQIKPVGSTFAELSNSNTNITVTCNDGYTFVDAPTITYTTSWGSKVENFPLTLSADKKSASDGYKLSVYDPNGDPILLEGNTVSDAPTPTEPTVNNHVADTTLNTSYTDGKITITITSTKNARYYRLFNVKAAYTENGTPKTVDFNVSVTENNACIATATFDVDGGITIDVTGDNEEVIAVEKTLNNCTGDVPDYYKKGETVDITLTANSGTEFKECQLLYNDDGFNQEIANAVTISSDKKTATIHYVLTDKEKDGISVYGNCVVVAPVGDDFGSINVYIVTLENLNAFAKVRFESVDANQNVNYYDLGKYVNRIKRIYTNVEKGATDVIRCANYNTKISVFQPVKSKITLDFGNVVVPSHNNDNTDFESTVKLFIPFVGFVDVPNDYTGETLNLQIDINVVTGNGLYRLIYDGTLIQTGDCTPSQDVLYKTADMELTKIGGEEWNEQWYMGLEPYLLVKWYESKNTNGRNNDFKKGKISSFTGFNSFDNVVIQPTANMLAREQEMILATLLKGVYVE